MAAEIDARKRILLVGVLDSWDLDTSRPWVAEFRGDDDEKGRTARRRTAAKLQRALLQVIKTDKAGLPIGPYSQGIKAEGFVFLAGEKGIDPVTQRIVPGGIEAETRQTLENIKAILSEAGTPLDSVVCTFVFMTDLKDFSKMNAVYAEYFKTNPPGRTTVEVKSLPAGAHGEITAFAWAGRPDLI